MFLHTPVYLIFLAIFCLLYWRLPSPKSRHWILLAGSYGFYSLFDYRFALYLAGLTAILFWIGKAIPGNPRARGMTVMGVAVNLGLLAFFKYSGGLVNSLSALLVQFNLPTPPTTDGLLLPIGISFFTFQGISYIVEIYRKKITPAALPDLALYLAFFPKLIAGPIVSPTAFLAWLKNPSPRLEASTRNEALLFNIQRPGQKDHHRR